MQARYYDPVIGRFYSNDPVGTISHLYSAAGIHGFNRYAYANNNPYKYADPNGESAEAVFGTRLGAAGVSAVADSPAPGPGDLVAVGILLYAVGEYAVNVYNESSAEGQVDDIVEGLDENSEADSHKGKTKKSKVRNLNPGESAQDAFDNFPGEANDNGVKTADEGSTAHVHTSNSTGEKTLTIKRPDETKQRKYRESQGI